MSPQQEAWIGLDPGRCKCGLVRSDAAGEWIADLLICNPRECWDWLQHWISLEPLQGVGQWEAVEVVSVVVLSAVAVPDAPRVASQDPRQGSPKMNQIL